MFDSSANDAMNQLLRRGRGRFTLETSDPDGAAASDMNEAIRQASRRHTLGVHQDPPNVDLNARLRASALTGGRRASGRDAETALAAAVRRAEEAHALGDPSVIAAAETALDTTMAEIRSIMADTAEQTDMNAYIRATVARRRTRIDS
jgi:hypothetical protein